MAQIAIVSGLIDYQKMENLCREKGWVWCTVNPAKEYIGDGSGAKIVSLYRTDFTEMQKCMVERITEKLKCSTRGSTVVTNVSPACFKHMYAQAHVDDWDAYDATMRKPLADMADVIDRTFDIKTHVIQACDEDISKSVDEQIAAGSPILPAHVKAAYIEALRGPVSEAYINDNQIPADKVIRLNKPGTSLRNALVYALNHN